MHLEKTAIDGDVCNISLIDYIIVFLLLFISGNPISSLSDWSYALACVLFLFIAIRKRVPITNRYLLGILFAFISVFSAHYLCLENVSVNADINQLIKLYVAFLSTIIVGIQFRYVYFKVVTFLSTISLLCFFLTLLLGDFPGIVVDEIHKSLLFYNHIFIGEHDSPVGIRNCGMFWEPGAFQGYINLVFLLYIKDFMSLYKSYKREIWILIITLITTFSTTGYIVFGVFLFFVILGSIRNVVLRIFAFVIYVLITLLFFFNIDFLGGKVESQYEESQVIKNEGAASSRIGSAIVAWENIEQHPYIGNGYLVKERYKKSFFDESTGGNGFFGSMNVLGIPMILIYLVLLYKNYKSSSLFKLSFVVVIVILLQGEYFLYYPLFWSLLFIKYPKVIMDSFNCSSYNIIR